MQLMYVNGWFPAVYMSCMSQNFRLFSRIEFIRAKLSNFLLTYTGSMKRKVLDSGLLVTTRQSKAQETDFRSQSGPGGPNGRPHMTGGMPPQPGRTHGRHTGLSRLGGPGGSDPAGRAQLATRWPSDGHLMATRWPPVCRDHTRAGYKKVYCQRTGMPSPPSGNSELTNVTPRLLGIVYRRSSTTTTLPHPLTPLKVGTDVRLQDPVSKRWDKVGIVVGVGHKRDYHIKLPSGRVLWRNRRFLRVAYTPSAPDACLADDESPNSTHTVPERRVRFQLPSAPPRRSVRQRRLPDRLGYHN